MSLYSKTVETLWMRGSGLKMINKCMLNAVVDLLLTATTAVHVDPGTLLRRDDPFSFPSSCHSDPFQFALKNRSRVGDSRVAAPRRGGGRQDAPEGSQQTPDGRQERHGPKLSDCYRQLLPNTPRLGMNVTHDVTTHVI